MMQSPLLKFESSAFAVIPGEDEETNPGIYGKTLASWLGEQLRLAGVAAEDAIAEDFGWCVPVKSPPYSLYVACANDGAADHWQIFTFVEGGLLDRILRKDKRAELLAPLCATVRRCLESSSVVHGLREETLDIS
jgi:hypothetical protein